MSNDPELDAWRSEWRTDGAVPAGLGLRVRKQSRLMRVMLAGDVLVTVVIGGGITLWAARHREPDLVVLAFATWIFIAAAWVFAIRNRRGAWSPAAATTNAFLELSIRRARGGIAATTFGTILYFVEIVFCLAWIYRHDLRSGPLAPGTFLSSWPSLLVGGLTVVFVACMVWYRRRKRAELSYLLNMRTAL